MNVQSGGTSGAKLKNTTASFSSLRVHGAAMMVPSTSVGLLGFGWFERPDAHSVSGLAGAAPFDFRAERQVDRTSSQSWGQKPNGGTSWAMKKDYEVGDGKPPTAGQFVKGKSENRSRRPPSCLPKGTSASFSDILMKELDARIPNKEGGGPKRVSKQRALIKNLVNRAVNGNARAIANLFKPVREHRLNLNNDYDAINISAERLYFVQELLDDSGAPRRTSGLSAEQKERFLEDFYEHGVFVPDGKLHLAPDHPLNRKPRPKMRPSTAIADDLLCELRERTTVTDGRKKFTVTKLEALVKSLLNQAMVGNDTAFSLLLTLFKQYGWNQEDTFRP